MKGANIMKTKLRAVLCVALCLILLIPSGVSSLANGEEPLSVFVAADIHYRPLSMLRPIEEQNNLPGDPLYYHTNSQGQLTYESDAILNELLSRFEASSTNILLIPGDLTDDGYWPEHLGVSEKLKQFMERTGKEIFVIPGNHDVRTSAVNNCIDLPDFLSLYADFGYDKALQRDSLTASYTADLSQEYRLIAIDACVHGTDTSVVSDDLFAWIEAQVMKADADGKHLIGMVHYSVLEHFKNQSIAGNKLCLEDYRNMASQFADWGIRYIFTGHIHANDISSAVSENGNTIYDIETNSLIAYPNSYRAVSFSDTAVTIETRYIDSIDVSFLPPGYTQTQLNLIQSDFPAYSYGYFKAGINCFINEYLGSPKKLAGYLNIESGTPAYSALAAVTETLHGALNLPLYDTAKTQPIDSVEEIAACVGIVVDSSEYKNLPDLIGSVYSLHYCGDENLSYNSPEIRLFKQSFNAALVWALADLPLKTANALFSELGLPQAGLTLNNAVLTQAAKVIYMKTAASLIFDEILKPVIESFITDSYAPADLNVTLEPYAAPVLGEDATVIISDTRFMLDVLLRIVEIFINFMKAVEASVL